MQVFIVRHPFISLTIHFHLVPGKFIQVYCLVLNFDLSDVLSLLVRVLELIIKAKIGFFLQRQYLWWKVLYSSLSFINMVLYWRSMIVGNLIQQRILSPKSVFVRRILITLLFDFFLIFRIRIHHHNEGEILFSFFRFNFFFFLQLLLIFGENFLIVS